MDLDTYALIMERQGKGPWRKRDDLEGAHTVVEMALRDDLARSKKVWTGVCCKDYWYWLMVQHSLLSWWPCPPVLGIPKEHPFSRSKRICILLIGILWSIALNLGGECFDPTEDQDDISIDEALRKYAILRFFASPIGFSLCNTINRIICKKVATCSCAPTAATSRRKCLERVALLFIFIDFLGALFIGYMAYDIANKEDCVVGVVSAVGQDNALSWLFWDVLFISFTFHIGGCCVMKSYWGEKKIDKSDCNVHIHWTDHQQAIAKKRPRKMTGETDTALQMDALK
eukprot:197863_1